MADIIGFECKTYIDAAGVGQGTWAEVNKVGDVDPTEERANAGVNDRSRSVMSYVSGRLQVSHEFNLSHAPGNTEYEALRDAFVNKTVIGIAFMDGAIATVGSEGWQYDCLVTGFSRPEQLDDHVVRRVSVKPAANTETEAEYVEVSS